LQKVLLRGLSFEVERQPDDVFWSWKSPGKITQQQGGIAMLALKLSICE
jgi:hypothetical protein